MIIIRSVKTTLLHPYENFYLCVRIKAIGLDYPTCGCKIPLSVAVYPRGSSVRILMAK